MGSRDAETKFSDAENSYILAEQAARGDMSQIDQRAFKMVVIDLDAALPGLDGVRRGRALLLKAASLYWLYEGRMSEYDSMFAVLKDAEGRAQLQSQLEEASSWALEGREILAEIGTPSELAWADDLVSLLSKLQG